MTNSTYTDAQREEVQSRIVAEAAALGGMITAPQLRAVLGDVPAGERAQAVVALQQQGKLETAGSAAGAIHSLVRPAIATVIARVGPCEGPGLAASPSCLIEAAPPPRRQDDPLALRNRINAISQDLDEALADACSIELPHTTIQNLLSASRATRAAADSVSN